MSIPSIPPKLISAIKKNKCVVFVGAGLSVGAGLPNWEELLKQVIQWCDENGVAIPFRDELPSRISNNDFLGVAQDLEEALDTRLRNCLNSIFSNQHEPTETHLLLPQIPFYAALTTNYDRLLESAYTKPLAPKVILYENELELGSLLREDNFYILKTHGTIDRIDTVIFGRNSYTRLIHGKIGIAYQRHLEVLLSTKTFFFVGFSLDDPDLKLLMEKLPVVFAGGIGTHYALMDSSKLVASGINRWLKDYKITILPYKTPNGDHREVGEFLTALITEVEKSQHSNSLSRPQTHSQKIDSSISLPNVGVAEEFSNNQVANDSQKSLWQNQLGELATITSNIVSSNTDGIFRDLDQKIEPHQLIRLHLLTTMWLSSRITSSLLDTHEINYLYLQREKLELTRSEKVFILRMLIQADSDYILGWGWFLSDSSELLSNLILYLAYTDPLEEIRSNAFRFLGASGIQVENFKLDIKTSLRTHSTDFSSNVRKACLNYLGIVGTTQELQAIGQAEIDDDSEVSKEALNSKYCIHIRINPSRAFEQILADTRVEIKRLLPELQKHSTDIITLALVNALKHQVEEVRLFAIEELIRRNEFNRELALLLKKDESQKIRELSYRQLIRFNESVSPEEVLENIYDETYWQKYRRDSIMFNSSYANPYAIIIEIYQKYASDDLWKLVEWDSPLGHIAYKALALHFFTENSQQIRADLETEFSADFSKFFETSKFKWLKIEKEDKNTPALTQPISLFFGGKKKIDDPPEARAKREANGRRNAYLSAALAGLALNGEQADVKFGRKYLSHEDYNV